jgi:muramidase (phage lysozyme)
MELPTADGGVTEFLSFVQSLEAPAGYNQIYSDDGTKQELDLANMTIDEVIANQTSRISAGSASSATGGLQIMRDTLLDLKKDLGLTGQEFFDEETQLALGLALLERRGLSKFRSGALTADQFADNLAMEWAALPLSNGKSYYSKVGRNRALTDRETFLSKVPLLAGQGGVTSPEEGLPFDGNKT